MIIITIMAETSAWRGREFGALRDRKYRRIILFFLLNFSP
jgi:hypothetical protein